MAPTDIELFGRKTFFIAPDTSLIPKAYLEEFLTLGFQTFIINDDYSCPLQSKVKEIIRLFPESILYFNIDASVDGIEWRSYIRSLQESIGSETLIGVFYLSRQSPADEEAIKSYYLRDLNVTESGLTKVIKATYRLLNLSTFFLTRKVPTYIIE